MNKPYVTVTLTLHNGTTKEIADYVDNSGRFVALGTQALAMLNRHDAIHYVDAEGVETFIPYHAIVAVDIAKESDEYTKPEDAFCKAEGGDDNADCEHTDLGYLYYCGGLRNGNIINTDGTYDTGAVVTDSDTWSNVFSRYENEKMYLVSDGNVIEGIMSSENSIDFGNTQLARILDDDTGDIGIKILNAPTHYAIYSELNPN